MPKVYRIKDNFNIQDLEALDYIFFPEELIAAKIVRQPLDGKAVSSLLERYYANPRFIDEVYNKNTEYFKKELGLTYTKKGQPRMTKKFKEFLSSWVIQIEFGDDGWIGFTSTDKHDATVFYNSNVLNCFCGVEIELLKEHDFIEEVEVEE